MRSRLKGGVIMKKYELTEELKEKIENARYDDLKECIDHILRRKWCTAEELECMSEEDIFHKGKELIEWERR